MKISTSLNHKATKGSKRSEAMRSSLFLLSALCAFVFFLPARASAQTPTELFNPPAKEYILGNTPVASNLVTQALAKYPDDEKLQKLKKLIEQQQQQNKDQKNKDKQNQDQKKQDQKKQDQKNQDQKKQDQKNKDKQKQDKQKQDQKKQDQKNQDQKKQDQKNKDQQEQKPQEAQPSPAQPQQAGQMSEEEAQQLLDAMKLNEKDQRTDLRPFLGQPVRVDKDW